MHTDPLTASRYPDSSDSPNIGQYIQNAVVDLSDNTFAGPFATTTARNSAFAAWVALGNTMRDGLHCHVTGIGDMVYISSNWHIQNTSTLVQSGKVTANIVSATSSTGTITFPFAYSVAPIVQLTVVSFTGTTDLIPNLTATPTVTGCAWRVRERSATSSSYTVDLNWTATGVA